MECPALGRSAHVDARRRKDFWEVEWDQGREKQSVRYASVEREERKQGNCNRIAGETKGSGGVGCGLISDASFYI